VYRFEYFWPEFHGLHQVWKSHKKINEALSYCICSAMFTEWSPN
jgi:hypothetical protein